MEYPEEIYVTSGGGMLSDHFKNTGAGWGRRRAYKVGYEAGKAERADPLAGYSNLTTAIQAGEPIDWAKLDELKVQCVKPTVGTVTGVMDRNVHSSPDEAHGWWNEGMDDIYTNAFSAAWYGKDGCALWIEGEVPLRRKTADQLRVGTYFLGVAWNDSPHLAYVGRPIDTDKEKTIYYAPGMLRSITPASEWVVIEEYGTFQKPEGK